MTTLEVFKTNRERLVDEISRLKAKFGFDSFTYPWSERFRNTMFLIDKDGTNDIRCINDERLDFWKSSIVQVQNEVYAFAWGQPITGNKYSNLVDAKLLQIEEVPSLDVSLSGFSLANYRQETIYLTGGVHKREFSNKVYAFDVET
eukprot:CAMPEP_0170456954 /NCGR_PEP_ID=MMETSP0123-20130129/4406_1 /TAXON_ID=182087 /ORGANISM="Favella ehrenbergii, Strain Fehren 1" /LENGTH=145 /DNA_ID=CAMNT_0010720583 /DNA_START=427 /DNA_END=864 /DNA_ORIENTATION=+